MNSSLKKKKKKKKSYEVHASKLKSLLALLCKFYGEMYHILCKGSLWVYRLTMDYLLLFF